MRSEEKIKRIKERQSGNSKDIKMGDKQKDFISARCKYLARLVVIGGEGGAVRDLRLEILTVCSNGYCTVE